MRMRATPPRLIQRAVKRIEAAGISVSAPQLEGHHLAGGSVERIVEACELASPDGRSPDLLRLLALDLGGHDPIAAVRQSLEDRELTFDTYSPAYPEPIVGFTRDQTTVRGACRVVYRSPLVPDAGPVLQHLQERLAARLGVTIGAAASLRELETRQAEVEAQLVALARDILPSVSAVHATYVSGV